MAELLKDSTASGKRNTGKTSKLTQDEALQILQQSLIECQKTGVEIQVVSKFYFEGCQYIAVLLTNVGLINGNLAPINGKSAEINGNS